LVGVTVVVASLLAAARRGETREAKMAHHDPLLEWRNRQLDLLPARVAMSPVPTDTKFAIDRALWSSMSWCQWVFVTAADSWQPANHATRLFHVADADTPDLLEHRLVVDSVPIRVLEGSSFVLVSVPAQWQERIDGVVVQGDIWFFIMKITLDRMMTITSDTRTWFQELRKAPRK
jgi:hypothetical protein